ncbi:MAG: hypothetical protein B6D41_00700 [Chloroflexi bacterium UTCFX4]|jgi:sterol desaturase/sphingolipid hydroxylase (fatty acid hydroxylase superfamily)|nr:MAG: hypothetical protein B6D41_00700 [Chloroflexi bacterium UTCFX4]
MRFFTGGKMAKDSNPNPQKHDSSVQAWAIAVMSLLIVVFVLLVFLTMFGIGPIGAWTIKFGEFEASSSVIGLALVILVAFLLTRLWPDFKQAIFEMQRVVAMFLRSMDHRP